MTTLVVYDSVYGNTQKVAEAIGAAIATDVRVVRANEASPSSLATGGLLVVGAPTQGGRPTPPIQEWLTKLPQESLKGVKVAAFDTRYSGRFVKVFGFAADKISEALAAKGGTPASPPQAFFVGGKKGPLKEGELERAAQWAKELIS